MTLSTLQLTNFRCYIDRAFEFSPGFSLITGPNGSGKSTVLEAIYLLGLSKSWRDAPKVLVRSGETHFRVGATSSQGELRVEWLDGTKTLYINGDSVGITAFLGRLPVVLFEPGSVVIVLGSPSSRRQLLDRMLSCTDPHYLRALLRLRRVLSQRNHLLRSRHYAEEQLFAWDVLLAEQAAIVRARREQLVSFLARRLNARYRRLAGSKDRITIAYKSALGSENYQEALLAALARTHRRDRKFGATGSGPHRDDLLITYNGRLLSQHGSRGEIRTATLSLLLLELEYMRSRAAYPPVLLLDDVFSELDRSRQAALLEQIGDTQTIITSTETPKNLLQAAKIELP